MFDADIARVNQTFFDCIQTFIERKNSSSPLTMDPEAQKNEIDDFYFNKLNAPRTEWMTTIIKGNYPNATQEERNASEVSVYSLCSENIRVAF